MVHYNLIGSCEYSLDSLGFIYFVEGWRANNPELHVPKDLFDSKIGICYFSTKHVLLRRKSKD